MPIMSISPVDVAIGAMSLAVGAIVIPGMTIPVLVGPIDISMFIDMIACACMEGSEKKVQSYIVAKVIKQRPTEEIKQDREYI
jgi:hypothetical protein